MAGSPTNLKATLLFVDHGNIKRGINQLTQWF